MRGAPGNGCPYRDPATLDAGDPSPSSRLGMTPIVSIINYNLGMDLVGAYVERAGGDRWAVFADLLASPRLPSSLV